MPRGKRIYSPDVQRQVIAEVLAGTPYRVVAKAHQMPTSTVVYWVGRTGRKQAPALVYDQDYFVRRVLELIDVNFDALKAIAGQSTDRAWLAQGGPGADRLAILYGVMADKTIRILAAIDRGQQPPALLPAAASER